MSLISVLTTKCNHYSIKRVREGNAGDALCLTETSNRHQDKWPLLEVWVNGEFRVDIFNFWRLCTSAASQGGVSVSMVTVGHSSHRLPPVSVCVLLVWQFNFQHMIRFPITVGVRYCEVIFRSTVWRDPGDITAGVRCSTVTGKNATSSRCPYWSLVNCDLFDSWDIMMFNTSECTFNA